MTNQLLFGKYNFKIALLVKSNSLWLSATTALVQQFLRDGHHVHTLTHTYFSISLLRFLCAVGDGCIHWSDSQLLRQAIRELALLVVVHHGLGVCSAHILLR